MTTPSTRHVGQAAELTALQFLKRNGLRIITRNYHCPYGEIDLIMRDREDIVFIEVRSRSRIDYGTAAESVNGRKKRKLIKAATHFLQKNGLLYKVSSRFDVVAIHQTDQQTKLDWIVNAFTVER